MNETSKKYTQNTTTVSMTMCIKEDTSQLENMMCVLENIIVLGVIWILNIYFQLEYWATPKRLSIRMSTMKKSHRMLSVKIW